MCGCFSHSGIKSSKHKMIACSEIQSQQQVIQVFYKPDKIDNNVNISIKGFTMWNNIHWKNANVDSRSLVNTCKWSLGQGNVFRGVCLSKGGWSPNMHRWSHDWGPACNGGSAFRDLHSGRVCIKGSLHPGGACIQGVGQRPPDTMDTVNEQAVCILLVCILVYHCVFINLGSEVNVQLFFHTTEPWA